MFRLIFYTIILITTGLLPVRPCAAEPGSASGPEYRLELRLVPEDHVIAGTVTVTFADPVAILPLRLTPRAEISGIRVDGVDTPYTFRDGRLQPTVTAGTRYRSVTVSYAARFDQPLPLDTVGSEDPSFGVSASIGQEGTFLADDVPWFPQLDGVRGRHRLTVTAPAGMVAVTAGQYLGSRTEAGLTVTEWHNDFPLVGLALAAGHFHIARDDFDGIQLLTFLSPENAGLAPGYLSAMRRHLAFYRDLLGPYPFAKFAVVENFLPTGYGLPSWTLLGKSVVSLPFILDTSLPHEIVHSWWGNAVEVDSAQGNWCEGLATYLADYLLKERGNPSEAVDYRRKILRDYAALVTPANDFPLQSFRGRMAKYQQAVGYGKGAMIFHMLRRQLGDQLFWTGLRQAAATGTGHALGWSDLERVFASVSGKDLRGYFRQWVEQTGAPELDFAGIRLEPGASGWVISGEIRQTGGNYRLELPLRLTMAGGGTMVVSIPLAGERNAFRITSSVRPERLEADPDAELFRRLAPGEVPPTVNDLLAPREPLVVVATGQRALVDAAHQLLQGLHWEHAEIIDEADLPVRPFPAGRDLLMLGWPSREELQPPLPQGLTISAGEPADWQLTGAPRPGDVLFAVLARRDAQQGTRALLLARAPGEARAVAAKIAHYGRYSVLLFDAGRNLVKETWEPSSSPLKFVFPGEP